VTSGKLLDMLTRGVAGRGALMTPQAMWDNLDKICQRKHGRSAGDIVWASGGWGVLVYTDHNPPPAHWVEIKFGELVLIAQVEGLELHEYEEC
jgi:hypothetical protein